MSFNFFWKPGHFVFVWTRFIFQKNWTVPAKTYQMITLTKATKEILCHLGPISRKIFIVSLLNGFFTWFTVPKAKIIIPQNSSFDQNLQPKFPICRSHSLEILLTSFMPCIHFKQKNAFNLQKKYAFQIPHPLDSINLPHIQKEGWN